MTKSSETLPRRLVGLVVALTAVPVILDLVLSDRRRVFGYLAADAFYYLTVARNLATTGQSTFDGQLATNGYHPLWQFFTAALYGLTGEPAILLTVVVVGLAGVVAAVWRLTSLLPDHPWSRALAPLIPVGPTALVLVPAWLTLGPEGVLAHSWQGRGRPLAGTVWAAINGMESAFVLAAFAFGAWVWARRAPRSSSRDAALLGGALALMTLSRLDHGLMAVGLLLPLGWSALRTRSFRPAFAAGAAFGVPIAAYLVVNKTVFGHALPVSGRLKSTFPHITPSFFDATAVLFGETPPTFWLPFAVRIALLVVPILAVVIGLVALAVHRTRKAPLADFDAWLAGASIGTLLLGAYDILFVPLQHQGHWYFPTSTITAALVLVRTPAWLAPGASAGGLVPRVVLGVSATLTLAAFGLHRTPHNGHFAEFYYDVAPALRAHYDEPPLLVSFDDGIVAFATGFPTMSGLGFTLDDEGVDALEGGRLLELAWERGYRRVTSLVYFVPWLLGPDVESNLDALTRSWPVGRGGEAPPFTFSIDYRTDDGEFVILSMEPAR